MGEGRLLGSRESTNKMGKHGVRGGQVHSSSCQSEEEWEALHAKLGLGVGAALGLQRETGGGLQTCVERGKVRYSWPLVWGRQI